jgi:hypothetical protein
LIGVVEFALHEYAIPCYNLGAVPAGISPMDAKANFVRSVQDLCYKLNSIIQDMMSIDEMKSGAEHPDSLPELFYKIAKRYVDNPVLRITWLQTLTKYHTEVREERRKRLRAIV